VGASRLLRYFISQIQFLMVEILYQKLTMQFARWNAEKTLSTSRTTHQKNKKPGLRTWRQGSALFDGTRMRVRHQPIGWEWNDSI